MAKLEFRVMPVTLFAQNCSLVWDADSGQGALVDPGGDADRLKTLVSENGVKLEKIIVTHGHLDHAGAVSELAAHYKVPVEGPHVEDKFWIDLLPEQAQQFGFAGGAPFTPERWLEDGDVVTVGGLSFDVLHCPGHTPGHVVLHQAGAQLAFVGDVLFQGSIGRSDFPRGNHAELVASIRDKLFPLGDAVRFVPGHGPMSDFGHERRTNPFVADPDYG